MDSVQGQENAGKAARPVERSENGVYVVLGGLFAKM